MSTQIWYGADNIHIDVTKTCFFYLYSDGVLTLPITEEGRSSIFGEPCYGRLKQVTILHNGVLNTYRTEMGGRIPMSFVCEILDKAIWYKPLLSVQDKLRLIADNSVLYQGNFLEERPEQEMNVEYLDPNAIVLELGSNIGRSTLVISSVLNDDTQFVTMETNVNTVATLIKTKELNKRNFAIEGAALSKRRLIQKEWVTIPLEDSIPKDYTEVNTISFQDLQKKHSLTFDTIVADCEGALYYIFQDDESVLDNIKMLIVENDYKDPTHRKYVEEILIKRGLKCIFSNGIVLEFNAYGDFYQVWKR
jgi:hypothetical protein